MEQVLYASVEDVVSYDIVLEAVLAAPRLDVCLAVTVGTCRTEAVACAAENVVLEEVVLTVTSAVSGINFSEEVLDVIYAVLDEVALVGDVVHHNIVCTVAELVGDTCIVVLVYIAVEDVVVIAAAVDFNAVAEACYCAACSSSEVVGLNRAAYPTEYAVLYGDVICCAAADTVASAVHNAEVIEGDVLAIPIMLPLVLNSMESNTSPGLPLSQRR